MKIYLYIITNKYMKNIKEKFIKYNILFKYMIQ